VLELEKELETERYKLGEFRKKHYQLAGASEGGLLMHISNATFGQKLPTIICNLRENKFT
jgi:hypothetical protein